jgi:hypothetical protein
VNVARHHGISVKNSFGKISGADVSAGSARPHLTRHAIGGAVGDLRKLLPRRKLFPPTAQVYRRLAEIEPDAINPFLPLGSAIHE